ncbi:MAG: hypothetical protein NTV57_19370 [Cyanobacteria bacterium]|nr:hypothetical protein [Cyanobacteriota bacterium]
MNRILDRSPDGLQGIDIDVLVDSSFPQEMEARIQVEVEKAARC